MARWRAWSNEPEPVSTVEDKEWRALQARASRANPRRADVFSDESRRAREASAANYKNRRMN